MRLATPPLLAYGEFLHFDKSINICINDLNITPDMIKMKIPWSKTNQEYEILMARLFTVRCPVAMLERYMAKAKIQLKDKEFLYRGSSMLNMVRNDKCPVN